MTDWMDPDSRNRYRELGVIARRAEQSAHHYEHQERLVWDAKYRETHERGVARLLDQRREQGLPEYVEDPIALAKVAAILRAHHASRD